MITMSLHLIAAKAALALSEVTCSQPFGEGCDVYKVMDKMFLLNSSLSGAALSNLKVTPDHGAMLRDIYPYIHAGWHMNKFVRIKTQQHSMQPCNKPTLFISYAITWHKKRLSWLSGMISQKSNAYLTCLAARLSEM